MSNRHAPGVFAFPVAVLVAVLGVTAALAATTWTVRPGGSTSLTSASLVVRDTKTGSTISCASSLLSGTFKRGSGLSGTRIGSITAASFTQCTNPVGIVFTLTAADLPWHVNVSSYNAATGVVSGSVSHIQIKASTTGCNLVIDGTSGTASNGIVKFVYTDSTAKLKALSAGGNLHSYNVSGCFGMFNTGNPVTLSATFTLSPKQTITSP